jgi:hypothetical protein
LPSCSGFASKTTHPIRVILDASSTADIKIRSRWTRALKYAWRERKTWTDLISFLRENGRPAGCARQFAAIRKKDQPFFTPTRPPAENTAEKQRVRQQMLARNWHDDAISSELGSFCQKSHLIAGLIYLS